MALKLTCPACAARFALAEDVRGKEAFCPEVRRFSGRHQRRRGQGVEE